MYNIIESIFTTIVVLDKTKQIYNKMLLVLGCGTDCVHFYNPAHVSDTLPIKPTVQLVIVVTTGDRDHYV